MGFMDKAKKLAEQAQQKLDEAQDSFNQGASPSTRRIPALSATTSTVARSATRRPPPPPRRPRPSRRAGGIPRAALGPPPGDTNQNPDPFKPLQ